jgi:LPS sulfotransferase NodH
VLGVKLHWDQLERLRAEALGLPGGEPEYRFPIAFLAQLLPGATYVRIVRLDIDRQAVSLWFAAAGGTWSVAAGDTADTGRDTVGYDFDAIDRCRRTIENAELHWDRCSGTTGSSP